MAPEIELWGRFVKRLLAVLGALVLVGAVVAVVVWQRPEDAPPATGAQYFTLEYAQRENIWLSTNGEPSQRALVDLVLAEAESVAGMSRDALARSRASVTTTIDAQAQNAAMSAAQEVLGTQPVSLRYSLTAIDPATGGVLAYVPGRDRPDDPDFASQVVKAPGQAIFPIDVVAGLQSGHSLDTVFDGRSPRRVAGVELTDSVNCGARCTLREALAQSSGIVMTDLIRNQAGLKALQNAARQAGVPESVVVSGEKRLVLSGEGGGVPGSDAARGTNDAAMRPIDVTKMYATFAAGGVRRETHLISEIRDDNGLVLFRAKDSAAPAFDPDPARSKEFSDQVTSVLKSSSSCSGAVCRDARFDHPDSGANLHAWTVGYTDRMAVTALVSSHHAGTPQQTKDGTWIADSGLHRRFWQKFVERL